MTSSITCAHCDVKVSFSLFGRLPFTPSPFLPTNFMMEENAEQPHVLSTNKSTVLPVDCQTKERINLGMEQSHHETLSSAPLIDTPELDEIGSPSPSVQEGQPAQYPKSGGEERTVEIGVILETTPTDLGHSKAIKDDVSARDDIMPTPLQNEAQPTALSPPETLNLEVKDTLEEFSLVKRATFAVRDLTLPKAALASPVQAVGKHGCTPP